MYYEVIPHEGVGDIRFGMSKEEVRELFPDRTPKDYKQNVYSRGDTDLYESLGIMIHYDTEGRCAAVEFGGSVKPMYQGSSPLGMTKELVEAWFESHDDDSQIDPPDITSEKLSLSAYVEEKAESIMVFRDGYYDSEEEE